MAGDPKQPFFVGYLAMPKALAVFLAIFTGACLGLGAVVAFATVAAQRDWNDASFQWGEGRQTRSGILIAEPYPVLYLPPSDSHPDGRAIPLSGVGKTGVQERAEAMDGQAVDVSGILLRLDDLEMIQVSNNNGLVPAAEPTAIEAWGGPGRESFGEIALKGELLDTKCFLGAMRPGQGKTHKLCANLCLIGGIPLTFVVYREEGPPEMLLLADRDGRAVTGPLLDHVSHYIELTGELERRGDLMVFKVDPATATRL